MQKFYLLAAILFLSITAYSQTTEPISKQDKALLDSMMANDEFLKMLGEKPGGYFDISAGISNGVFSTKNNSLNAEQAETKKIFITPTAGYYHKSGLGIALNGYISNDSGTMKMYQYAINPFYNYADKKVSAGISYTRYIAGASVESFTVSPYKNDIYANVRLNKPWLQPGLALGYANGKIKEYFDTSFTATILGVPRLIKIRDTIVTKLYDFSLIFSMEHEFDFGTMFTKEDNITLTPSFMLNTSSQKWNITHSNSLNNRRPAIQTRIKNLYGDGTGSAGFQIQSIAFLTQATYTTGKFYLQPQVYLDYYLPETTSKRFTSVFSVVAGFTF